MQSLIRHIKDFGLKCNGKPLEDEEWGMILFTFFLVALGFEFRALHLLSRCSIACAMLPALFALVTLEKGSHFFAQANLYYDAPILGFHP
jgi:hypothetical protein